MIAKLSVISTLLVLALARQIYDPTTSYVTPITKINFESQITKIRQTTHFVTIVQFYKHNDGFSKQFAPQYDEFTNEYRGVFKIGFCDCDDQPNLCERERIEKFPTFRIYPPVPIPPLDVEGEITTKNIMQQAAKFLHNNAIEITSANINTWINENPSVPKVILFTEQKGTPMIYKGLSVEFEKKLFFGIVRKSEDALVQRYNILKFPMIIVVKTTEKKPFYYKGEMKFQPIFQFLNIYSEVYVPGGGSSADSAATKSWLTEVVPEMHLKSASDICLGQEGVICVILMDPNGKPKKEQIDMLKTLHDQYDRKINRGFDFKYMWLNGQIEKEWVNYFQIESAPKLIFLNPGKRKRYLAHEGDLTLSELQQSFEKVNGGDAKFNKITNPLPEFQSRPQFD